MVVARNFERGLLLIGITESSSRDQKRGGWLGWALLGVAVVGAMVLALIPAPYAIYQPGPVVDTLGTVETGGREVPLISIPDQTTYPTEGSLSLLTVGVVGNRERLPGWFDVVATWFDKRRAAVPIGVVYPEGISTERADEANRILMENSKREAVAAALTNLGHEFTHRVTVTDVLTGGPADGRLQPGDTVLSFNGETFRDVTGLRDAVAAVGAGNPGTIVVLRNGLERSLELTPMQGDGTVDGPVLGIEVSVEFAFPFDVDLQLQNVGGSSAGMMFALGIVDKLTPGAMTGGESIAGTGTMSSNGIVGPIGGIRQKLFGAKEAGADWFLAPADNCDEVVGNVPEGLTVFRVSTLDEALAAVEGIAAGDTADLAVCTR